MLSPVFFIVQEEKFNFELENDDISMDEILEKYLPQESCKLLLLISLIENKF